MQRSARSVCGVLLAAITLAGGVLFAASDARSWADLPVAAFLTNGERERWLTLTDDEQREAFARECLTARGDPFGKVLLERIEGADRLFGSPRVPGARTLRGRIYIILGPPARIEREAISGKGRPLSPDVGRLYTNAGPLTAGAFATTRSRVVYRFFYDENAVAWVDGLHDRLIIEISVDPRTGNETLGASMPERDLRRILEQVAESSRRRTEN